MRNFSLKKNPRKNKRNFRKTILGGELIRFEDGEYNGDIEDGKKNGTGTMKYSNGDIYTGIWDDDDKHGTGTMKYNNGDF